MNLHVAKIELKHPPAVRLKAIMWECAVLGVALLIFASML